MLWQHDPRNLGTGREALQSTQVEKNNIEDGLLSPSKFRVGAYRQGCVCDLLKKYSSSQ